MQTEIHFVKSNGVPSGELDKKLHSGGWKVISVTAQNVAVGSDNYIAGGFLVVIQMRGSDA